MKSEKGTNGRAEILIAEDSPTQAEKLRYLIEEHGYAVTTAANGKEALAAARRRKPTLILSDVMMPEMDGYALCRSIKADEELKDIPVILVTTLADPRDVIKGLECGADNFVRKPYDERYLLSRIGHLLMNIDLRKSQKMQLGVEIELAGRRHFITAERQQILDLLISTYEQAVQLNNELRLREKELAHSNQTLHGLYRITEGLNAAVDQREVAERALERALEIPGVQAGWISLRDGDSGFHLAAARNLPPALMKAGALEGECLCRRRLISGELDSVTNIIECERLRKAKGDTRGLIYHASVPLWLGDRTLGVMNLAGPKQGLFDEGALKVLYSVGNQVAVALERARLHDHLEKLVEERTATLTAEITERQRIQEQQARLVAIFEATSDLVGTATPDGRLLYSNQAGRQMLGLAKDDDLSALRVQDVYSDWARKLVIEEGIPHAISHGTWSGETALRAPDGQEIPILQVIIAHKGRDGSLEYLSTIGRDITRRKQYEDRIGRLNRLYSVLSAINTTIVRVGQRQELFDAACRVAVDHGKFMFAWIGTLDPGTQKVTPVAQAGHDDGYLAQINLTAREDATGNCKLTARALIRAEPMVCNDIASDEDLGAWRAEALNRGYRSVVVLPLIHDGNAFGVFALYAPTPGIFDAEEMRLLAEMAGDISFAVDYLNKAARLDYLAYFDVVTGLPNRTLFNDRASQRVRAADREQKTFFVIMLDLERFSAINETFGQQAGDELLRQFGQRLKETVDETDILARLTGDRFGIATRRGEKDVDIVRHILEPILLGSLSQPFMIGGKELRVSAKAGVSSFPIDGKDIETLLLNCEAALRKAKISGDKYLFYTPGINAQVAEKLTLENKLRRAVEQRQFVLHYQPKVDLESGQIDGLEALMRWNDPDSGLVQPSRFIPILEESGMILEAGRWALEKALADSRQWQEKGLKAQRIAVNVSPLQLRQKDFVSTVERAVSSEGYAAGALGLEITESLIMQDIDANIQKLGAIREMGVEVAIDDFGTGYSSLSYVARLPINALKIDRAFIMNMASKSDDLSIVSAVISLAHTLNLRVIAEGVETEEQAKLLRQLKCDTIQGYLFSPAVPADQIELFLREKKSLPTT